MSVAMRGRNEEITAFLREKGATEPVTGYDRDIYGRGGMPGGESSRGYRTEQRETDVLEDPNAILAKLAAAPEVGKALKAVDANSASEGRSWASRRSDNRTTLIRAVAKQFGDELTFVRGIAGGEKATKTVAAIDALKVKRQERYEAISSELREERRLARQAEATTRGRGRGRAAGRGATGRGSRESVQGYGGPEMGPGGPYEEARSARGRARPEGEDDGPILDADGENQLRAWLGANPEDKRSLLNDVHELDLIELDILRETAVEESATKTTAAIEGLMLARQQRVDGIIAKMAAEDERLERLAERAGPGGTTGAGRGRRGASTTQQRGGQTGTSGRRRTR